MDPVPLALFAGGLHPAVGARTAGHKGSRHPHPLGTEQCCSLPGRSNSRRDLPMASGDSPRVEPTHPAEACEYWEGWDGVGGLQGLLCISLCEFCSSFSGVKGKKLF